MHGDVDATESTARLDTLPWPLVTDLLQRRV